MHQSIFYNVYNLIIISDYNWEIVLYRYRAGIPWRDLPERFGNSIHPNPSHKVEPKGRMVKNL